MSDNKSIVDKIFEELKIELNWEEPIIDFHCQESDLVYIGNDAMTRDIYEMMYPLRDYSTGVKKDFAIFHLPIFANFAFCLISCSTK